MLGCDLPLSGAELHGERLRVDEDWQRLALVLLHWNGNACAQVVCTVADENREQLGVSGCGLGGSIEGATIVVLIVGIITRVFIFAVWPMSWNVTVHDGSETAHTTTIVVGRSSVRMRNMTIHNGTEAAHILIPRSQVIRARFNIVEGREQTSTGFGKSHDRGDEKAEASSNYDGELHLVVEFGGMFAFELAGDCQLGFVSIALFMEVLTSEGG